MPGDHVSNFIKHFWRSPRGTVSLWDVQIDSLEQLFHFVGVQTSLQSQTWEKIQQWKILQLKQIHITKMRRCEPGSLPMWWLSHLFVPSASVVTKCNHHNNPLAQKPSQVPQVAACRDQTACYGWIAWHWRQDAWRLRGHTEPGNCLCPLSLSSPRSLRKPGVGLAHECPLITAP